MTVALGRLRVYGAAWSGYAADSLIGAATNAGLSNLAGQASVSLINNNGDISAVLHDLGSSQGVHSLLTAMATAGAVQGINTGLGINGWTASAGAGWPQVLGRNLLDGAAAAVVRTAINGGSLEDNLTTALVNGFLNTAASQSASWIGGNTDPNGLANAVSHAIAGCLVGAGRATGGGYGLSGADGCSAGALGATIGHIAGSYYNPNNDPAFAEDTIRFAQAVAGVAGALAGGNQASADIAAAAGATAVENNQFSPKPSLSTPEGKEQRVQQIKSLIGDYIEQMIDVCGECSRESLKNVRFSISPLTAAEAGVQTPNSFATYDRFSNTATIYQDFFGLNRASQISTLFHEYVHSLPSNLALYDNATVFQRAQSWQAQPWETHASQLEGVFLTRFGGQIFSRSAQW